MKYERYLQNKEEDFESLCKRCGKCCGADDDPCWNLVRMNSGTYFCKDYKNRLGRQKTVSGNVFNCISIREHIARKTLTPDCIYGKIGG